ALLIVDETSEREVLRTIGRRPSDPRVRRPIAGAAHECGDVAVDADLACRFTDLVRTALGTGRRLVHVRIIGRHRPQSWMREQPSRLSRGPGNPGFRTAGWPSG